MAVWTNKQTKQTKQTNKQIKQTIGCLVGWLVVGWSGGTVVFVNLCLLCLFYDLLFIYTFLLFLLLVGFVNFYGWLVFWLVGWLFGWLFRWLVGLLVGRFLDSHSLFGKINSCLSPPTVVFSDSVDKTKQLSKQTTNQPTNQPNKQTNKQTNKPTSKQTNKPTKQTNKQTNKQANKTTNNVQKQRSVS